MLSPSLLQSSHEPYYIAKITNPLCNFSNLSQSLHKKLQQCYKGPIFGNYRKIMLAVILLLPKACENHRKIHDSNAWAEMIGWLVGWGSTISRPLCHFAVSGTSPTSPRKILKLPYVEPRDTQNFLYGTACQTQEHYRLSRYSIQLTHVIHRTSCTAYLAKPNFGLNQWEIT